MMTWKLMLRCGAVAGNGRDWLKHVETPRQRRPVLYKGPSLELSDLLHAAVWMSILIDFGMRMHEVSRFPLIKLKPKTTVAGSLPKDANTFPGRSTSWSFPRCGGRPNGGG